MKTAIDIQKNNYAAFSVGDILQYNLIISSLLPCEMNFLNVYIPQASLPFSLTNIGIDSIPCP